MQLILAIQPGIKPGDSLTVFCPNIFTPHAYGDNRNKRFYVFITGHLLHNAGKNLRIPDCDRECFVQGVIVPRSSQKGKLCFFEPVVFKASFPFLRKV